MANFIPKIEYGSPTTTITFTLPPEGDNLKESNRSNIQRSVSGNGTIQFEWNYNEKIISPSFTFLTQSLINSLRTFFTSHALKGKTFKYYEHSDEASFITCTLDKMEFDPKRVIPDGSGGFIYDLTIRMRTLL